MTGFLIGLIVTAAIVGFAEMFRKKIDLKFYAALNLAVIPFIYIGFSVHPHTLMLTAPAALLFLTFAYPGYQRNYLFVVSGLALHSIWDIVFPYFSAVAPHGYDLFCITIDVLLATYFYVRLRPGKRAERFYTHP